MENATQLSTTLPSGQPSTINPSYNHNPSSHVNSNTKSESSPLSSSPLHTSQKPIKENPTEDPPIDKEEIPEVRLEEPESVRTSRPLILPSPIIAEHEIHKSPSMNAYFSSQAVDIEGKTSNTIGKIKIDSKPKEADLVQRRSSNREDSYREDPPVDQKRSSMKKKKSLVDGIRVDESNEVPISVNTEVVRESGHTVLRHDNKPKEEVHSTNNQQTTTAPEREHDVALEVRRNTQIREPEEEDDSVSEYSDDDDDDNQGGAGNQRPEDRADNIPAPQPIQLNQADVLNAMAAINRENNNRIIRSDIAMKLRLSMALFFFGFLGSSFLRSSLQDNEIPQDSFIVLYVFFLWVMFERSYRFKYEFLHNWQKRDTLFDILDVFGFGLFVLLLNLKVTGHISEMSNIFLYPLALCVFYIFFSQAPKGTKESRVLFRLIITVQVLLLARKIDDNLDWDWLLSIILIMVYLGMIALYCLLLATTFMFMLLFLMCGLSIYGNLDRTVQFMGVKWNLIFTSLSIVVIVLCVGASQGTEDGTEILLNSLRALEILGIYMTAYTGIFFSQIATFMFYFATEENTRNARIGLQAQATITMQKAKTYFVMLSSTYFVDLKNSFVIKDKNKLGKMKATLENAKAKKNTPKFIKKIQDLLVKLPEGLQARMENFKKDKEIFDKHFTGKELKAKNKCEEHNKHNLSEPHINKQGLNDGVSLDNKSNQKHKVWLSEGDDVGFACVDLNESQKDENSGLCYICFTNEANSIMVDCGHGGVCYDCAAEFLKRKGQCMECRGKVTQVAKVKVEKGFKNILIGDEVGKLT